MRRVLVLVMVVMTVGVVMLGCKNGTPRSDEAKPVASSAAAADATQPVPATATDASELVAIPAGRQFPRKLGQEIKLRDHKVFLETLALSSSGDQLISITIGIIEAGYNNGHATLAATVAAIESAGKAQTVTPSRVEVNPHNGGRAVNPRSAGDYWIFMEPSIIQEVVISFEPPLTAPVRTVRLKVDDKPIDVPITFGPANTVDIPPVGKDVEDACAHLLACCDKQTRAESKRACTDLAESARRLELLDQCKGAADSYCR